LFHSKGSYAYRWQLRVFGCPQKDEEWHRKQASKKEEDAMYWIKASAWAFATGGFVAIITFAAWFLQQGAQPPLAD
jgi:hypothetical protein